MDGGVETRQEEHARQGRQGVQTGREHPGRQGGGRCAQTIADHQHRPGSEAVGQRAHRIGGGDLHDVAPHIEQAGQLGGAQHAVGGGQHLGRGQDQQAVREIAQAEDFRVTLPASVKDAPVDGRVLVILAAKPDPQPREQVKADYDSAQIFGVTVDGLKPGGSTTVGNGVLGFPTIDLKDVPAGRYTVQAVLHRYDTYHLGNGKTVKLPAPRGAGQNWRAEPGNLFSTPQVVDFNPARPGTIALTLDQVNPPITPPADTPFVRHFKMRSALLSRFWGRDIFLTAHVLVPRDFDKHPEARFPLMIFHGHFPADFGGFRTTPPDPDLKCQPSERFNLPCYNRTEQEEAYAFYQQWIGDKFPRFLAVEIDHSNPYYDDSYAVNSANLGPYGDAITHELVPAIEKEFRGLGQGWARFLYGGSTGGWESLGVQIKYPDDYNGAFAACPDPIDFRQFMLVIVRHLADRGQPMIDQGIPLGFNRGPHPAAAIMANHENMFHLQHLNGKLQNAQIVGVLRRRQIGYIAVDEHLAGIEIDDFVGGDTAVGAADPEIFR